MQFLLVRGSDKGAILARFHLNNTCFLFYSRTDSFILSIKLCTPLRWTCMHPL